MSNVRETSTFFFLNILKGEVTINTTFFLIYKPPTLAIF